MPSPHILFHCKVVSEVLLRTDPWVQVVEGYSWEYSILGLSQRVNSANIRYIYTPDMQEVSQTQSWSWYQDDGEFEIEDSIKSIYQ